MELDYFKLIVTTIIVISGWIIGHYFTSKRDISNKRREIRLNHLISSYLVLTNELTERGNIGLEESKKIEKLISEIQLFGNKRQVELAKKLALEIGNNNQSFCFDEIINSLRDDLRKELELDSVKGNVVWARFNFK